MTTTYDVRINETEVWKGKRTTTYYVRWTVDGRRRKQPFRLKALAESFRSELLAAARKGEAFRVDTGRPVSMGRAATDVSWYDFACRYVDMKWKGAAATYRRAIAEALTTVTVALVDAQRGRPPEVEIRSALFRWAFNSNLRDSVDRPADVLLWIKRNSRPVSALAHPATLRVVLSAIGSKLDGTPAAATVVNRKRMVLSNALSYAVEQGVLATNPLGTLRWKAPKASHAVDRRVVPNPVQARTLLNALSDVQRSGPRLVAMFAAMYFGALRPEEATNLRKSNLLLPEQGWGELHLEEATPHAGRGWTDSGAARDRRQLKHRAVGDGRAVPCPPELTELLHAHLDAFGTDGEGRLFRGERGGELPVITIGRAWRAARARAFTGEVAAGPLARRPYDLRHAAVSTWLNGGVPPAQVAEWAGHSVEVLLKVYAKCLDGQDEIARRRVQEALGHS